MRKIFLFLCAVFLSSISLNAATITSDGTARLYFNMSAVDWWIAGTDGNGNFGYFFNNSTGKNAWSTHAVKHSGNTYYLVIPEGTWANVILTRNNTSTSPSWNNKWNQTGDITLSSTSNYISKFSEGSTSVTWGTAVKPASNASATADPATIFVNAQSTLTSALTSNDDINTIQSTSYSVSPETGSLTDGKFTATAAGEYTVTATITYYPNGYTSLTSTTTATTTITVKELPTYTVTVNAGEGGTVTEGGIVTEGSSINITATPAENYEFNGWTITTGEGTFDNENAISTTFSPTSDATIQANFRSTATYALKVIAGANIASAEGNVDPVTLGESYDITATPVVGYTFAGWTAEPTENATFATQESTTQVTVLNGSVNVTATATETMSALTTANSFDQDTPPAEVPTATATEIGIVTTAEVTATDVTGYTFVGWELTNCVSDDELTAKTIAVKSNGDGAAATATAKYEIIKLTYTVTVPEGTEKCYIAGDMNTWTFTEMENQGNNVFTLTIIGATKEHGYKYACGNEWKYVEKTADGNEVSNRSYTANDKVLAWNDPLATNLYLRGEMNEWGTTDRFKKETEEAATAIVIVALEANTTYEFKVASADWSEGYSSTTAFTATSTQTLSTDVQDNAKLTTVAAGDYTFTWDLTTKKLTVTYPPLPTHQVTTTANPAAAGTVTGTDEYEQGKTATLTATPTEGYKFVNWTAGEEVVSTENPYTFNVTADVALVANFEKLTYTVTATATNGTVTGASTYTHGTEVTLTATPAEGYEFVNWTIAGEEVADEATYTFVVEANVELVANFKKHETTINIEPGNGKLSGAILTAFPGDTIILADGEYTEEWSFALNKAGVIVKAAEGAKPVIKASSYMQHYATITFIGITFDGQNTAEYTVYSYENTSKNLTFKDCEFTGYTYYNICQSSSSHVDSLIIDDCLFEDNGYAAIYYTNPASGVITCSYAKITNTTIYNVGDPNHETGIIDIREGVSGANENEIIIDHVTIYDFKNPAGYGAIMPYKSGNVVVSNSIVMNPETTSSYAFRVYNGVKIQNTLYYNCKPKTDGGAIYTNCLNVDPLFVDAANGNFALMPLSPARGKGTDGSDLGDPRWYTSVTKYTVTATASPAEAGTVTGAGDYTEGVEVTLVATPAHGYNFVNWTKGEEVVAETAEYTFTASANVELVANFEEKAFTGNIINVEPGEGTLATAVENAEAGDKLVLADGTYELGYISGGLLLDKEGLTITAAENAKPVILYTDGGACLQVVASTTFEGITFDGGEETKASFLITTYGAEVEEIVVYNCEFKNYSKYAISDQWGNGCHIGSLTIDNCLFHDGGCAVAFSNIGFNSKQPCGHFELKNTTIYNMVFTEWKGVVEVPSLGEATGNQNEVVVDHVTISNFDNRYMGALVFRKTENIQISNSIIEGMADSTHYAVHIYYGNAKSVLYYNSTLRTDKSGVYTDCKNANPLFVDAANGNFNLLEGSPAIGAATDGSNLGDPRWVVSAPVLPTTYTVAVSAENGTVTGAGEYEAGAEVTLTATPDFDYEFVKWSDESTENPLTITVEDNIELEAIFAEVAATEKKESGVFSISAHKTATFATGNLQYHIGNKTWRFAKQQYQVVGEQNINLGDPAFTGWIDMLGWSNGDANNYGVNPSNKNEDYAGEFVDWGTKMGEGWSTLSAEEWSYLLNTRENAASLKQTAKVDTILGLLLFPDGWVMPEDVVVEAEMDEYFEINIYNYTLEQWTKLEQAGAIFLPAAGRRAGGYGNMINYDQVEETNPENLNGGFYRHQDNTNIYCYYWTSTINAETKDVSYLHNVLALGNDEYTIGNGAIWDEKGRYGQSVRLAKVAYDKHEVTVTSENGTVTGAGEYTHGTEITLTATPAEHYVFVNWAAGETVLSTENPYIFTLEADIELKANFALDTHTITATAENGTVEGAGTYEHGAEVTLTATADEGYEFVKWSNELTENPLTITVTEDVTISAIFQEVVPVITHTITWYTAVGETTEVTLAEGAAITKPETNPEMEGYVFMGWTDECFVAEDGSDFTAIEDFGTADADKEYYAVFAVETTTDGGGDEIIEKSYTFSSFTAGTQYAENETHQLDDDVTIYTTQCHFTTQLRIYSSSTHDGYVISNQLPGNIISMSFNMGNKKDNLAVYGSTDGSTWNEVGKVATTSESYEDYEISFGSTNYTYFKLDVAGSNQIRIAKMGIIYATAVAGEPTTTYSNYMTTCTPEEYTIEWSVNGEVTETTTVVEGDALVLPEAPAAPDACSEKVFMGWATTATVNADGSAITWVNDTIVPESDKTYYAVFATKTVDEENSEAGSVTLAYKGSTTTNMTVDGNNAATVGLNAEEWSVTAAKGGNNNAPGLNKDGSIRLYYAASGSNTITVTSTVEGLTIGSITITYTNDNNNGKVLVNGETINGTDGTYTINANSFVITNGNTSNVQVHIESIVIEYAKPAISYIDYSTICVVPEEYTVTFDYSADAGYITVNDVRISEKEVKYAKGTELTVKALTFNDWRFDAWEDEKQNELTTEPEYTFTVTADVVLKAIITYIPGAVGTGVENNNVVSSKTMKVIQNGRLMIIREGKTYNAQGQMIE